MAQGFSVEVTGLTRLLEKLQRASPRVQSFVKRVLTARLTEAVQYARRRYLTGGTTSDRLAVRTGQLRASFGSEVRGQGAALQGRLGYIIAQPVGKDGGNALVYARTHEGWPDNRPSTTIRPKKGKYLAIPLDAAKTPAGVARGRPRDFPDTYVAAASDRTSRKSALIIFQTQGDGLVEPLFLLMTGVTIPARPALRPTMAKYRPLILDDLTKGLPEAILPKGSG